jgi:hypothetical protein
MFIVRFAPSRAISAPLGIPKMPTGMSSAARTQPMRAVEPVVARTNQGSATNVIEEPVRETVSATRIERSDGLRSSCTARI